MHTYLWKRKNETEPFRFRFVYILQCWWLCPVPCACIPFFVAILWLCILLCLKYLRMLHSLSINKLIIQTRQIPTAKHNKIHSTVVNLMHTNISLFSTTILKPSVHHVLTWFLVIVTCLIVGVWSALLAFLVFLTCYAQETSQRKRTILVHIRLRILDSWTDEKHFLKANQEKLFIFCFLHIIRKMFVRINEKEEGWKGSFLVSEPIWKMSACMCIWRMVTVTPICKSY